MHPVASDGELIEFVYDEARLIDEKRLEDWYELFAEDGCYWVPLTRGQQSGRTENSLFFEDKLLLKVRIVRLRNPHAYSQAQPSWCQHVLQAPAIEDRGEATGVAVIADTIFVRREPARSSGDLRRRRLASPEARPGAARDRAQEGRIAQLRSCAAFAAAVSVAREWRIQ